MNTTMTEKFYPVLRVLRLAEKLKYELRHSYTSTGRQESVAEHTWRMALMAVLIEPFLEKEIDIGKVLKMIIIHDLVEAEAGDIPVLDLMRNPELRQVKHDNEQKAITRIRKELDGSTGDDIYNLWQEFEKKETYEAKLVNALDKLEVQIQHNEADISTWEEIEYELVYSMEKYVDFDRNLKAFKDIIEKESEEKMEKAGIPVSEIKKRIKS